MSFEGYSQAICENGHRFDLFDFQENCECGARAAWENVVDDTNCLLEGIILDWSSLAQGKDQKGREIFAVPCEGGPSCPPRFYQKDGKYLPCKGS